MIDYLAKWRKIDWLLLFAVLLIVSFSLSILYSLNLNIQNGDFLVSNKQVIFVFSGLILFFLFSSINYSLWSTYAKIIYIFSFLILLIVLLFGTEIKGTTGWLSFGFFSIQPVEFIKIGLIIFLARYFSKNASEFFLFKHILISGFFTAIFVVLVILQSDLGSALVLLGIWAIILLFTGIQKKHLLILLSTFVFLSFILWSFVLSDYQKARITTFINPGLDPTFRGYNVIQSTTAVGSGQFLGRGLSLGSQSSLRFLPEPGTDFIFAVIAEELGFIGVILLLLLFLFVFYRMFLTMNKSKDDFASYIILGTIAMFLVQLYVNIGMNMGISPITGIPLPLVSAGGSSLWSVMIVLGIVQSIHIRNT